MARPKTKTADSMKVNLEGTEADSLALEQQLEEEAQKSTPKTRRGGKTKAQKAEDSKPNNTAWVNPIVPVNQAIIPVDSSALATGEASDIDSGESTFSERQLKASELLADLVSVRNVQQVANAIGASDSLVYSWLARPDFVRALRLRRQAQFVELASAKLMGIYDREMNKNNPGSRILEQIGKTLGFFSDADNINLNINVDSSAGNFTQVERESNL